MVHSGGLKIVEQCVHSFVIYTSTPRHVTFAPLVNLGDPIVVSFIVQLVICMEHGAGSCPIVIPDGKLQGDLQLRPSQCFLKGGFQNVDLQFEFL